MPSIDEIVTLIVKLFDEPSFLSKVSAALIQVGTVDFEVFGRIVAALDGMFKG